MSSVRERVVRYYSAYAPDKLHTVDAIVEKYAGHEDALLHALSRKYGPEPPEGMSPAAVGFNDSITGPPLAGGGGGFREVTTSSASVGVPPASHGAGDGGGLMEVMRLVGEASFRNASDERRWEEAWLGRIPLNTVCKETPTTQIIVEGYGFKHTSSQRAMQKWQRRYFVIIYPFVYYFENDKVDAPCRGAIYLWHASVTEDDYNGRSAIEVSPVVARKPQARDGAGDDFSSFHIAFDSPKIQTMWLNVLKKLAAMNDAAAPQRSDRLPPGHGAARFDPEGDGGRQPAAMGHTVISPARRGVSPQRPPLRPPVAAFPISPEEMLRRMDRLACERPPTGVLQVMFAWLAKRANELDPTALWTLMDSIEAVERAVPTAGAPPPSGTAQNGSSDFSSPPPVDAARGPSTALPAVATVGGAEGPLSPNAAFELAQLKASQSEMQRRFDEQLQTLMRAQGNVNAAAASRQRVQQQSALVADGSSPSGSAAFGGQGPAFSAPYFESPPQSRMASFVASSPGGTSATGGSDEEFQRRLERMRSRKAMVERMLSDMPSGAGPSGTSTSTLASVPLRGDLAADSPKL